MSVGKDLASNTYTVVLKKYLREHSIHTHTHTHTYTLHTMNWQSERREGEEEGERKGGRGGNREREREREM